MKRRDFLRGMLLAPFAGLLGAVSAKSEAKETPPPEAVVEPLEFETGDWVCLDSDGRLCKCHRCDAIGWLLPTKETV